MAKILVVGGGGREHALIWSLARENRHELLCAPGNAGTGLLARNVAVNADDLEGLVRLAAEEEIELTIIGPEAPLAAGIVDHFQTAGLTVFGPTQAAARLESSKLFARDFMHEFHIPHPAYAACETADEVWTAVEQLDYPVVLKADGLAAGKGVVICADQAQVESALELFFEKSGFGAAGHVLSVEECLFGIEMSVFALCDGENFALLGTAQDFKRALDGDEGPNTGGMGSLAPSALADRDMLEEVAATIIQPTLDGMKVRGIPYTGFLYVGLMITEEGPMVIEYNVRMGDPETQVVLPLLDQSLYDLIMAALDGRVPIAFQTRPGAAVGVVLAAKGYPGSYGKGMPVSNLDQLSADTMLFHAGTVRDEDGALVSSGGRVLSVVCLGSDIPAAARKAYAGIAKIHFPGGFYRRDIGRADEPGRASEPAGGSA